MSDRIKTFFVTWLMVLLLNQIFIFHACFMHYCILSALPHTCFIAFVIAAILAKTENEKKLMSTENSRRSNNKLGTESMSSGKSRKRKISSYE